jgi:hypothetical protein
VNDIEREVRGTRPFAPVTLRTESNSRLNIET